MNAEKKKKRQSWRGWWWKAPAGLALLVLVAATIVLLAIDPIANTLVNRSLQRFLPAGGTLQKIDIRLSDAAVELNGLTINAPQGFGDDPLLSLGALRLDVDPMALADGEVAVEQLTVHELSVVLVRDKDGQLSPLALTSPSGKASNGEQPADTPGNQGFPAIPSIRVDRMRLEKITVRVIDYLVGQPWNGSLGIDLSLDDLQLKDLLRQDILLGRLHLVVQDIVIDQPPGYSEAPLLALQTVQVAAADIDLEKSRVPVETVLVENLRASLERNPQGVTNIERLRDAWLPAAAEPPVKKDAAALEPAAGSETEKATLPTLLFEDLRLNDIALQVQGVVDGTPCRAGFDRLDVSLTDLTVGDMSRKVLSLGSFALDLKGVAVDQPPGFEKDKLASLARLEVRTERLDLASPALVVSTVAVTEPAVAVIVTADKVTNLQKLKAALLGPSEVVDGNPQPPESGKAESENGADLPAVRFDEIKVSEGALYFRNNFVTKEGLELPLENAHLLISGLKLFEKDRTGDPATVEAAFELLQPGKLPKALFGAEALVGPVDTLPPLNGQVRFVGLKLDTLGNLVPPATRIALGATGLDASVAAAVNNHAINLFAWVLTDQDIGYNAIHVQGPLDKPSVEIADIFSGAILRVTDGLFNLGGSTLLAGASVVKGGVRAVGKVGEGVWEVGKNLGVSVFEVSKGVLTLDGEDLKEGLGGATIDTVKITAGSAKDTGSAGGGGLGDSVSKLKGDHRVQRWEKEIPTRYRAAVQQAKEALAKMPYPPVVED